MPTRIVLLTLLILLGATGCAFGGEESPSLPTPIASPSPTTDAVGGQNQGGILGLPTSEAVSLPTPVPTETPVPKETRTVQRGTVERSISLPGKLEPVVQTLAFAESGVMGRVHVERGQQVEAGQLLAELDMGDLPAQMQAAQEFNAQDRVALDQSNQLAQAAVRRAEVALDEAIANLDEVKSPPKPEEFAAAEAALAAAESNLMTVKNEFSAIKNNAEQEMNMAVEQLRLAQNMYAEAKREYERIQGKEFAEDEDKGAAVAGARRAMVEAESAMRQAEVTVQQAVIAFDTARNNEVAAVKLAESEVYNAQAEIARLRRGTDRIEISQAEAEVRRAEIALEEARQQARPSPALVRAVASSRLEVQRIAELMDRRRLFAPFSGEVSEVEVETGMSVQAYVPVMAVSDPGESQLIISSIPNDPTISIRMGMEAEVTFRSFPNRTVPGTVASVPDSAALTSGLSRGYTILYNAGDLEIGSGELANVDIILDRKEDVLWLPPSAVQFSGDRAFANLAVSGENASRRIEIEVGLVTSERVEIVAGLDEGDVVVDF
jgi:multidrug efflux pump subunit AcrA (membrane-fusion protein)